MCGSEIDIVHERTARSYCTKKDCQIVSYEEEPPDRIVHGLWCKEERKCERGSPMYLRVK